MDNKQDVSTDLNGKIALVTGGTKGIGKAIADRLHQSGATVITTARTNPGYSAGSQYFIAADLSKSEEVTRVFNEVNAQFGGIDILINNMGANTLPAGGFSC